jgi:hypothetical protein
VSNDELEQTVAAPEMVSAAPTVLVPPVPAPPVPPVHAPKPGAIRRWWRRFWRTEAMREAALPMAPQRAEFLRRARLAVEVARRVRESSEPFEGSPDPVLCHLYGHAIRCELRGLAAPRELAVQQTSADPAVHWGVIEESVLLKAVGDPEALSSVKQLVETLSLDELEGLPAAHSARLANASRTLATALLAELEIDRRITEALWLQRLLRLGLAVFLAVLAVFGVVQLKDLRERRRDVGAGKPWRASSTYYSGGCKSPAQQCEESPDYFVHTQDERNPWLEFDLGSPQRISAVRVNNRKDCCSERSTPMVVEVSTDEHTWRAVARRDAVFSSWLAQFPATNARWVRLRLDKKAPLHLTGVRILR